ncbi:MAG: hypothetical protein AMXMBFR82_51170 [Candidatus Hydrogenedentota bacterium]
MRRDFDASVKWERGTSGTGCPDPAYPNGGYGRSDFGSVEFETPNIFV